VRRIEVPAEADGVLGTAVRRATPSKAVIVHPIQVRSAARRADGMATEIKRTQAQLSTWQTTWQTACHAGTLPRKFRASDVVPVDVADGHLNRGNWIAWLLAALRRTVRFHSPGCTPLRLVPSMCV